MQQNDPLNQKYDGFLYLFIGSREWESTSMPIRWFRSQVPVTASELYGIGLVWLTLGAWSSICGSHLRCRGRHGSAGLSISRKLEQELENNPGWCDTGILTIRLTVHSLVEYFSHQGRVRFHTQFYFLFLRGKESCALEILKLTETFC